jgi:hypothetical protein
MLPFYEGFSGFVERMEGEGEEKFMTRGVWSEVNNYTACITELPIGMSTAKYRQFLLSLYHTGMVIGKNRGEYFYVSFFSFVP